VPLIPAIALKSTTHLQPFHEDSADQIIVAKAREEIATIISKEDLIRKYPHVKTLWLILDYRSLFLSSEASSFTS
jgi:PIN domain nuclease of toxin-antitoxin system